MAMTKKELRGAATYPEQKLGLSRDRMAKVQLETLRELKRRGDG